MKRIALVGAAALVAVALSAGIGSASASATVLCESSAVPCPAGEVLPAGSWFTFGGGQTKLVSNGGFKYIDLNCSGNVYGSKSTAESGLSLPAEGESLHWNCSSAVEPGSSCSLSANSTSDSLWYIAGKALMRKGSASQPLSFSVKCVNPSGVVRQCTYSASDAVEFVVENSEELGWIARTGSPTLNRTAGPSYMCGSSVTLTINAYLAENSFISRL